MKEHDKTQRHDITWTLNKLHTFNAMQYNTMQEKTRKYNAIHYNAIQAIKIKYNTIHYNALQYNTKQCKTFALTEHRQ